MNKKPTRKLKQNNQPGSNLIFSSSLQKKYLITIITLIILSVLNVSLKSSDKINSNVWNISIELKVTSVTLLLVFVLWLPFLIPWFFSMSPKLQGSLNWLREQGIEEVETNLLRIKLKYGVEEASKNYEEKIWNTGATNTNLTAQETYEQIEKRYRDAIKLIDAASDIDSKEALNKIDQLANYYDKVRDEMPSGYNRTRLITEISSTMWALIPKVINFPVYERLNSSKGGERISAYKYIEWNPSTECIDLLLSRAIGILEMPFGQYSALLALRRVIISSRSQLDLTKSKEIIDILNWSTNLDYIKVSRDRQNLMIEIVSMLE